MYYIVYKGNCYSTLNVLFSPKLSGSDFFKILELIEFPLKESENVLMKYALTELVSNSVRALHERKRLREVAVDFQVTGNFIKCVITDYAGGFDPAVLPIDINADSRAIDILSDEFQMYREKHSYNRFGIGLVSAKLALDAFHLVFIDGEGKEVSWHGEGSVDGTRITAAKRISRPEKDGEPLAVVRRARRHSIFTKVRINGEEEAYLVDISMKGVRLLCIDRTRVRKDQTITVNVGKIDGMGDGLCFTLRVRWLHREGLFWQIGGEFVRGDDFSTEQLEAILDKIAFDPTQIPGLVVIRGS
ncbi:MAG TPA: hypothetical protein ENN69_07345 [Spirochaetia bacterium]|nr:hypothetical protein [Spirochaetia bacterium]